MSEFDYAVIVVLVLSLLLGVWRGFVRELLSLAGWPIAFISSKFLAVYCADKMPSDAESTRMVLAYLAVFFVTLIVWGLLARLISKLMKFAGLGGMDKVLGAVFGMARGGLLVLLMVWLVGLTRIPEYSVWTSAQLSSQAEDIALMTRSWLPDSIAARIHYRNRGI